MTTDTFDYFIARKRTGAEANLEDMDVYTSVPFHDLTEARNSAKYFTDVNFDKRWEYVVVSREIKWKVIGEVK